jgi:energy-coupling factor transport system permease protein
MNVYLYLDKDTVIHRLDPRTKAFLLLTAFAISVMFKHPLFVLGMAALIFIHTTVAQAWSNVFRLRTLIFLISIMGIVLWAFYAQGDTPLFWKIELEPVLYGVGNSIKLASMMIAGITFLSTTTNEELSHGLIRLGLPYPVAFAITTALRLVPTFVGTGATIIEAQRSRGLDLEQGHIFERMRKYVPLLVPVFLLAIRGTESLAIALESKGFRAPGERTFLFQVQYQKGDYAFLALIVVVVALAGYLRFSGYGDIPGLTIF